MNELAGDERRRGRARVRMDCVDIPSAKKKKIGDDERAKRCDGRESFMFDKGKGSPAATCYSQHDALSPHI